MTQGLAFDDPEWLKAFLVTNARQLGHGGQVAVSDSGAWPFAAPLSHPREDASHLG
ncbi:MAG: hypothetical protein WDM89_00910 [Rhizomicrobium sp.]